MHLGNSQDGRFLDPCGVCWTAIDELKGCTSVDLSHPNLSLNNYQVKLLAAALMLVDHTGAVFFPDVVVFRVIGRFSFPLFILLLIEGEKYTQSFEKYCFRLLLLGILSQPIYQLLFNVDRLNILFTLLLGLACLRLVRAFPKWQLLFWLSGATIAQFMDLEYQAYGVGAIALLHCFRFTPSWWAGWTGLHLGLLFLSPGFATFQMPAIVAPLLLKISNHQKGRRARGFYLFYPLHLLVLWLIRHALTA
jgi:TraX protein